MQKKLNDYGWTEALPDSHDYLGPRLIKLIKHYNMKRVLDIGSGNGELTARIKSVLDADIVGIEYDKKGCEIAQKNWPDINFYNMSVYDSADTLLKHESLFDGVISAEVIEHLYFPAELVTFSANVLKPGGKLIITTPYHGYWKNLALSLTDMWDHHHNPLWDGGHIKFWSIKTITKLLENNGFNVINVGGVGRLTWLWKSMVVVAEKK